MAISRAQRRSSPAFQANGLPRPENATSAHFTQAPRTTRFRPNSASSHPHDWPFVRTQAVVHVRIPPVNKRTVHLCETPKPAKPRHCAPTLDPSIMISLQHQTDCLPPRNQRYFAPKRFANVVSGCFPDMLHVKPVPPAPAMSRQKPQFSGKGKSNGLAVHVSTVAAQLGSTITGWLLSELTAKSAQSNLSPRSYDTNKSDGNTTLEFGEPKAVFYTPKPAAGPPSPGFLGIPLGPVRSSSSNPKEEGISDDEVENDYPDTKFSMPRIPPPARTSPPPPEHNFPAPRKTPIHFTESLPIAPKQLLPPIQATPVKSVSQRKPTPVNIISAPDPNEELNTLPSLPLAYSNFPIPYVSALDSPPSTMVSAPPAPLVPSSPRFNSEENNNQFYRRPRLQRSTASLDKDGFAFGFPPVIPEKDLPVISERDIPRAPAHRRPRVPGRRTSTSECMQNFMNEYVEMRRQNVAQMGRSQRFPVVGQSMTATALGSIYTLLKEV